jgi:hypothetical protein
MLLLRITSDKLQKIFLFSWYVWLKILVFTYQYITQKSQRTKQTDNQDYWNSNISFLAVFADVSPNKKGHNRKRISENKRKPIHPNNSCKGKPKGK